MKSNKIKNTKVGDDIHFYINGVEDRGIVVKMNNEYVTVFKESTQNYDDIQMGIVFAANGDTLLVAGGTYSGDGFRDIDFYGKEVTLLSYEGAIISLSEESGCVGGGASLSFDITSII